MGLNLFPSVANKFDDQPQQDNMTIQDRIYAGLRKRGLSHIETIAAMANAGAESGFNPTAYNSEGGGAGAHGFWQWRGDRWRGLQQYGRMNSRDPYDFENQLDYFVHEYNGPEAATKQALAGVTDPSEAARIFRDKFERPGGHGYGNTDKYAQQFAAMYDERGPTLASANARNLTSLGQFAQNSRATTDELNAELLSRKQSPMQQALDKQRRADELKSPLQFKPMANGQATLPDGTPLIPNAKALGTGAPTTAVANTTANTRPHARPSTAGNAATAEEAAQPEKMGLFGSIAKALYPNREDPRQAFRDMLGGVGVGLGQMSHGSDVNLQPYFNSLAARRQAVIDSQQAAYEAERRFAVDELTAQTGMMNARTAQAKLAHTIATDPSNVDYTTIGAAYPELQTLTGLAAQGDEKARTQIATYLGSKAAETDNPMVQQAFTKYVTAAPDDVEGRMVALDGLSQDEREYVVDLASNVLDDGTTKPSAVSLGEYLYNSDPAHYGEGPEGRAKAVREAAKLQSGAPPDSDFNPELQKQNYDEHVAMRKEYGNLDTAATNSLEALRLAREATETALNDGTELSKLEQLLNEYATAAGSFLGTSAMKQLAEAAGIPTEAYNNLEVAEQMMMRAIAASYTGQGTITDFERRQMANEVVNTKMTNLARMQMIERLEALAKIDKINAQEFRKMKPDGTSAFFDVDAKLRSYDEEVMEISRSAHEYGKMLYYNHETDGKPSVTTKDAKKYREVMNDKPNEVAIAVLPQISDTVANFYAGALNPMRGSDGEFYPAYRNMDGVIVLLGAPKGVTLAQEQEN